MLKLAHIVNPVVVKPTSDLYVAQPIAFESMQIAQAIAATHNLEVQLYSAQFSEDEAFAKQYFQTTPNLERSVLDFGEFKQPRKLPLLQDILNRLLVAASDADYLIYTNADITLMPHFYLTVAQLIQQGYDAFVINRRTISSTYQTPTELPLMYAEVGKAHPGHDCFIFKREAGANYQLDHVCIGISLVGKALLINLISHAQRFAEFRHFHLTFHLGNDTIWQSEKLDDYTRHNLQSVNQILAAYESEGGLVQHPLIQKIIHNRNIEFWTNRQASTQPQSWKNKLRDRFSRWLNP
ncbi:hypothetical protein [Almyronema epifaneia]|uniref:Glycosyltransferase family 2 protein n=1 Tax=Almyronema epifaneia S1 TaxID=2991925 RepID=A0ABW6IC05_9CYAN